jgi:hypothetical protein
MLLNSIMQKRVHNALIVPPLPNSMNTELLNSHIRNFPSKGMTNTYLSVVGAAVLTQPWLLVALMIGYGIGNACFYSRTRVVSKINGSAKGACIDCH